MRLAADGLPPWCMQPCPSNTPPPALPLHATPKAGRAQAAPFEPAPPRARVQLLSWVAFSGQRSTSRVAGSPRPPKKPAGGWAGRWGGNVRVADGNAGRVEEAGSRTRTAEAGPTLPRSAEAAVLHSCVAGLTTAAIQGGPVGAIAQVVAGDSGRGQGLLAAWRRAHRAPAPALQPRLEPALGRPPAACQAQGAHVGGACVGWKGRARG